MFENSYYNRLLTIKGENIKYRIREGVRSRDLRWSHIFADCSRCTQSIGMDLQAGMHEDSISNEVAAGVFRGQGWYVNLAAKHVLCPICKRKGVYINDGTGCH